MSAFYVGDRPGTSLMLVPARNGQPVGLDPFDGVTATFVAPDGSTAVRPAQITDDGDSDYDGGAVEVDWPEDGLTQAGLWRLTVQLTGAGGLTLRVDPYRFVVQADDGWHSLASARHEWSDAPADDMRLYMLLAVAREQVLAYKPLPAGAQPPVRHLVAQLMQARNTWNAGRVDPSGGEGGDGFALTPYPLDWTVKQVLRPKRGIPVVA